MRDIKLFLKDACDHTDGFHSYDELYLHRNTLFCALTHAVKHAVKSTKHADGTMCEGYFVAGIVENTKSRKALISYHLPLEFWDFINAVEIENFFESYDTPQEEIQALMDSMVPTLARNLSDE